VIQTFLHAALSVAYKASLIYAVSSSILMVRPALFTAILLLPPSFFIHDLKTVLWRPQLTVLVRSSRCAVQAT
jgi:hypothetical protein